MLTGLTLLFSLPTMAQQWQVYDASVLPSQTGGAALDLTTLSQNAPGPNFEEVLVPDPDIPGNSLLRYVQPDSAATKMYRFDFEDAGGTPWAGSELTLVARIRGLDDWQALGLDRLFDLQYRLNTVNSRDELRLHYGSNEVELDRSPSATIATGLDLTTWHIYRIAIFGDSSVVYLDEDPTPVLTGRSTATTGDLYLKIGDGSGDKIGGLVDWVALDTTGAYAPAQSPLDPALFTGVGSPPMPVQPSWMIYHADDLPTQTGGQPFDLSTLSQSSPGPNFEEGLVGDPDIPGNSLLRYVQPDSVGSRMYRFDFDAPGGGTWPGTDFTLVARLRGLDDWEALGLDRVFDLQYRHGNVNARDEFRINYGSNTLDLDRSPVTPYPTGTDITDWHIYRIAVFGDSSVVYLDENPIPVLTGRSTSSTNDTYFKMGDGSGAKVGGWVDWVALDTTGAYSPLETALDSTLFTGIGTPPTLADIVFITRQDWKDANGTYGDSLFVAALHNTGYNVILPAYSDFAVVDSADAAILQAADLVILGRGISSGDFDDPDDVIWETLETPLILMSNYVARANRLRWFDSNDARFAGRFGLLQASVEAPTDTVFTGVNVSSGLIDYAQDYLSFISVPNPATVNGKILLSIAQGPEGYIINPNNGAIIDTIQLADYNGNLLMARFAPGDSMYSGGSIPAAVPGGWRTFFTVGDDQEFGTRREYNFYVFTETMQQVFLNEVDYLIRGPERDTVSVSQDRALAAQAFTVQAYPNPFGDELTLGVHLRTAGEVSAQLFALDGRLLQQVSSGMQPHGQHRLRLNTKALPAGLYLYRVAVNGQTVQGKLIKR